MDFTFKTYEKLLNTLLSRGFSFCTLNKFLQQPLQQSKTIILRHDVEEKYSHALQFAQIQHQKGIQGSYYFRLKPANLHHVIQIIRQIADLGHEIGYHYDDLSECKGDFKAAIHRFQKNLAVLRAIAPITTMTMEGAPLSKFDNRLMWASTPGHYNYQDFGILAEPYFDLDFDKVFYLTDTGRRWDGWRYSVRDKLPQQTQWIQQAKVFHATSDIIQAVEENRLPHPLMMTFHPQRWNNKPLPWLKELLWQNIKNQGKRMLIAMNKIRD